MNEKIESSVNDTSDNNESVKRVLDSGFVPPCGVSNIIYSIEDVTGNVRRDVGNSHVASDEAVVGSDSTLAPPPPASSEVEMVDHLAVGIRTRPPDLYDGGGSRSVPSLQKGTKKRLGRPRCYSRLFFARQLVPCLPQLSPVVLVVVNYEACTHAHHDGTYYLKFNCERPA